MAWTVRFLLWLSLLLFLVVGIVAPLTYLWIASQLPQLENEFDLERYLRQRVEGERMSLQLGLSSKERNGTVAYQKPDFGRLPKDLVAFYIDGWGCPTFFQTPRETGLAWSWRVLSAELLSRQLPGDGSCEWQLANQLAWAIDLRGGMKQALAASRIHAFLTKDQLVAYDLSALIFERGLVGVEDASTLLFHKPLEGLRLEELAELELALPPNSFFRDVRHCRSVAILRQDRDFLLERLAHHGLIPEDRAKSAEASAVSCTQL
jgi:hypothetical protein